MRQRRRRPEVLGRAGKRVERSFLKRRHASKTTKSRRPTRSSRAGAIMLRVYRRFVRHPSHGAADRRLQLKYSRSLVAHGDHAWPQNLVHTNVLPPWPCALPRYKVTCAHFRFPLRQPQFIPVPGRAQGSNGSHMRASAPT